MRSIRDIPLLEKIPVLVRAPLNVPVKDGKVVNDYRLRRAIPTITYLRERGAKVILISHIGEQGTETLSPVADALKKLLPNVSFFGETIGERVRHAVRALHPGDVLVLENLRRDKGEKQNSPTFARELASLADVFVEDSFDTCHRPDASIIGVPELLPSYAGLLVEEEVVQLTRARSPKHKAMAVIGGAKFSTKEAVLTTLLGAYDEVFVGGALANDFLKAAGYPVGKSLVSPLNEGAIKNMLTNPRLVLPVDSLVVEEALMHLPDARNRARVASLTDVRENEVILDHGPRTSLLLGELVQQLQTVLWNGPLGNYENGFVDSTHSPRPLLRQKHPPL
jgi:phosphoglycerate kinase